MLIGRCNKVFEVCNTLLRNHNAKFPFESRDLVLLDSSRIFTQPLSLFFPNPDCLSCSCSTSAPHPPFSPTSLNIQSWQKRLLCFNKFWMTSRVSKYQHLAVRGKNVKEWTHRGGARIIGLGEKWSGFKVW